MSQLRPSKLVTVSSESELFPATNLLDDSTALHWKCGSNLESPASIEFEFDGEVNLSSLEVRNSDSAFLEVFVLDETENLYFQLLVLTPLMSTQEATNCENGQKSHWFLTTDFIEQTRQRKWKRMKVSCTQPFNKTILFGLSSVKIFGTISSKDSSGKDLSGPEKSEHVPLNNGADSIIRKVSLERDDKERSIISLSGDLEQHINQCIELNKRLKDFFDFETSAKTSLKSLYEMELVSFKGQIDKLIDSAIINKDHEISSIQNEFENFQNTVNSRLLELNTALENCLPLIEGLSVNVEIEKQLEHSKNELRSCKIEIENKQIEKENIENYFKSKISVLEKEYSADNDRNEIKEKFDNVEIQSDIQLINQKAKTDIETMERMMSGVMNDFGRLTLKEKQMASTIEQLKANISRKDEAISETLNKLKSKEDELESYSKHCIQLEEYERIMREKDKILKELKKNLELKNNEVSFNAFELSSLHASLATVDDLRLKVKENESQLEVYKHEIDMKDFYLISADCKCKLLDQKYNQLKEELMNTMHSFSKEKIKKESLLHEIINLRETQDTNSAESKSLIDKLTKENENLIAQCVQYDKDLVNNQSPETDVALNSVRLKLSTDIKVLLSILNDDNEDYEEFVIVHEDLEVQYLKKRKSIDTLKETCKKLLEFIEEKELDVPKEL